MVKEHQKRRSFIVEKINEIRKQKGIKLSDIHMTDEDGKELSKGQVSMLFSGKRKFSFWHTIQMCKALHVGLYLDGEWFYIADRDFVDTHFKIGQKTRDEEITYETHSKDIGPILFQWTKKREKK